MTAKLYLAAWRKHRGLTLDGLAKRAKIPRGTLGHYESGHVSPTIAVAGRLAQALEVGLEQLLGVPPGEPGKKKRKK